MKTWNTFVTLGYAKLSQIDTTPKTKSTKEQIDKQNKRLLLSKNS